MTIEEISAAVNQALTGAGYRPVRVLIETNQSTGRDIVVTSDERSLLVRIYPVIIQKTSFAAVKSILCEIGHHLMLTADENTKKLWEKRLVSANVSQVNQFQAKLSSGNYPTFEAIITSIERAADRLVALHLANGLLSNGQSAASAKNINVVDWGTTAEFATGKKPYSLIPLLSVYTTGLTYQHFSEAFADLVLSGLSSVAESSVKTAYAELLRKLTKNFTHGQD